MQVFNHYDHPWTFLGDVAFIREDQVDKGTLSHELAHLLGQRKDFYNIDYPDCRPFGGSLKKILVAGFYHKKQNHFAVPKVKSIETSFLTSYPKQPVENEEHLTFQLKDKNQVLQEISRPVYKTRLGFLHKKGHSKNTSCKAVPFDFSYLDAIFSIPWHKKLENLRIVVLGPQKNEIFSSSIPKEE